MESRFAAFITFKGLEHGAAIIIQRAWRRFYPRVIAAKTIQRHWRRCRYNPMYTMCGLVLMRNMDIIDESIRLTQIRLGPNVDENRDSEPSLTSESSHLATIE